MSEMTIDSFTNDYIEFCLKNDDISFKNFMVNYNKIIPFSLYQDINVENLEKYIIRIKSN